jgi:hypothetical protein
MSVLRATWPGLPGADPAVPQEDTAEPDAEQTMILQVPAERSPELSEAELSEANHGDEGEAEQSTERGDEDGTTAGSQLTEARR